MKEPGNEQLPKKLGDGTFGMVFEARSPGGDEKYALKVLYDVAKKTDRARIEGQHKKEMRVAITVHENLTSLDEERRADLTESDDDDPKTRLVLPIGYCEKFDNFWGKSELEEQGVQFSSNAYIMEKFDQSLKDLLEHRERPLKSAPLSELERSAMPIIEQLARGLHTLHAAGLRHQDIKPANIYYKNRGDLIDFKLGDLGCLVSHDQPVLYGSQSRSTTLTGFGTRHYRSIEQVDYWDCAECSVTVKSKGEIMLKTNDPKFKHTIISAGDLAGFAKREGGKYPSLFDVKEVTSGENDGNEVRIALKPRVPDDTLTDDPKTQVLFYKNPSIKTDLFGLAGILYEIVTAGQSPEQFYKLLYNFDTESTNIEENILSRYESWQNRMLDDPQIGAIFMEINRRDGNRFEFVDRMIVGAILRGMMSNAQESYYEKLKFQGDEINAWSKLIKKFKCIIEALEGDACKQHAVNLLTGEAPSPKPVKEHEDEPAFECQPKIPVSDLLGETNSPDGSRSSYHWREAGAFLKILAEFLSKSVRSSNQSIVLLAPDLLTLDTEKDAIYARRQIPLDGGLSRAMLAQDPVLTRSRRFATQFEPIWWQYGVCRVAFLLEQEDATRGNGEGAKDRLLLSIMQPLEFGYSKMKGEVNDFILCSETMRPQLYRIVEEGEVSKGNEWTGSSGAWQRMRVCQERESDVAESAGLERSSGTKSGYLIKSPRPSEYYAGMFGSYIYRFLVRGSDGIVDFPQRIHAHIRNSENCSCFSPVAEKQWNSLGKGDWSKLKHYTLKLILWLSLGGGSGNRSRQWEDIRKAVRFWINSIEKVSGVPVEDWDFSRRKEAYETKRGATEDGHALSVSSEEWEASVGPCGRRRFPSW